MNNPLLCGAVCGIALTLAACGQSGDDANKNENTKIDLPSAVVDDGETSMTQATPADGVAPAAPAIVDRGDESEPEVAPLPATYGELMAFGRARHDDGDLDRAVAAYEAAIEERPHAARPRIEIARVLLDRGEAAEARAHAEAAVEEDPSSSYAWNTLGRVELAENAADAAITSFTRATEENEDNSYAWNNLGYVFLLQERWDEAAEALEQATSGTSPRPYMWNNLGMAYEHTGELDLARAAYRQGADNGSSKAVGSLERLEGVESLEPMDEPTDESLEPMEESGDGEAAEEAAENNVGDATIE